ncbi:carboxypeptidase regulatory-like domain-containing protein [Candidatus Palauibacter sp.]|uniref:TonB-dependent receptor n=1 Tax=Candidatus Palauibacter sp. TaxID=3101350 RepID=UPI003D09A5C2
MTKPMYRSPGPVSHPWRFALLLGPVSTCFFAPPLLAQDPPTSPSSEDTPAVGTVFGRVLRAETQTPIAAASVEIRLPAFSWFLVTDDEGFYRADGIPAGPVFLVARALDRDPLAASVVVPAGGDVPLDLALERRPVAMPSLFAHIVARRLSAPGLTRAGFREEGETELRALDSSPGVAEAGLTLDDAGIDPADPTSVLYVRGAASDLKLVLLDGAPVYAPFHLSGLLDAFPDGVLDEASLYIGGTPARYDGGLSYVLDLKIREGDAESFRVAGAADVLGGTLRAEGPIGPAGRMLLSGRALHGLGYPMITNEQEMPYGYGDLLGRLDYRLGPGKFTATGFWNRESVLLDIGRLEDAGAVESAYWGNLAGSASYRVPLADGTFTLRGAHGRFGTGLPLPRDKELDFEASFADVIARTVRTRTEALFESGGRELRWAAGGGFDSYETVVDRRTVLGGSTAHDLIHAVRRADVVAGWGEAIWEVAPQVEVRGGFRTSYFASSRRAKFAPRGTVTWHPTEAVDLRVSAGRFFQVVRGPESILSGDLTGPTIGGVLPTLNRDGVPPSTPGSSIADASHLVVGLANSLENGVDVGFETYFKSFDDLPDANQLHSLGMDLWAQAKEGPVRGWVGYSIAFVRTDDPEEETPLVGRQLLSGGLSSSVREFDFGIRLAYGAGLSFASVTAGPEETGAPSGDDLPVLSGAPEDSYLRVDAEISRRWVASIGRSSVEIAPYVRVLNALDRRDALFYQTTADQPLTRPAPLASLPVIAIFGVSWSF